MRRHFFFSFAIAAAAAIALCACANPSPDAASNIIGADRDAHGCIGSAGYSWCEYTQQCERPWELAKQKGFANSQERFARYCAKGGAE
ncbi:hypothetical protein M3I53_32335 [Paraburkholderia sp. CNPSo 3272]|uniref:hypothetical protein n=1 Tax=Paraburkholderia sp. CNPSo 3272 TaxID=2940931 RepID=UPI0020B7CB97|nr:hypothetical protein [Paraburkholderia sp. CNPSo 3272]MCP3727755.1 hypothetical protein [Paraburkholderia sp. CNPSo 3272]